MGRKLRFFITKNQERKKALTTLVVSVPLSAGVVVRQSSVSPVVKKPSELVVSLPLAAYNSAPVQDLAHLQTRLKTSRQLPPRWIDACSQQLHTAHPLVLCSLRCEAPLFRVDVLYCFRVDEHLKWTLSICGTPVEQDQCQLLASLPAKLSTLSDIVTVLEKISTGKLCIGNPDKRFMTLIETHHGSFQDPSGKCYIVHDMMCKLTFLLQVCEQWHMQITNPCCIQPSVIASVSTCCPLIPQPNARGARSMETPSELSSVVTTAIKLPLSAELTQAAM